MADRTTSAQIVPAATSGLLLSVISIALLAKGCGPPF
jgi:hypothetical protein